MLKGAAPVIDERRGPRASLRRDAPQPELRTSSTGSRTSSSQGERYKDQEIGTVTIFQSDLRIATNVTDERGRGRSGTRVSREVNDAVLRDRPLLGGPGLRRHATGTSRPTSPSGTSTGRTIGMLYVGMLERPYIDLPEPGHGHLHRHGRLCRHRPRWAPLLPGPSITHPLRRHGRGHRPDRPGRPRPARRVDSHDEIGQLARSFNQMTENLQDGQRQPHPMGQDPGKTGRGADPRAAGDAGRSSSSPRSWPRSARWPRASPTRSTTP